MFLAFVFAQLGFLGHDVGHRAFARGPRRNAASGLLFGNLLTGIGRAWWTEGHNAHHGHPNEAGMDPNADIPILAFTEEQARGKRGLARLVVRHQAYFLFPIFCLQGFNMLIQSVAFQWHYPGVRRAPEEIALLALHHLLYAGLSLAVLGPGRGILSLLVHRALFGLYADSVFAPNHKWTSSRPWTTGAPRVPGRSGRLSPACGGHPRAAPWPYAHPAAPWGCPCSRRPVP